MPVHNSEVFLKRSIESIQRQTHTNWELIAVDDHSDDQSLNTLRNFSKNDYRIKVFENQGPTGPAYARNRAFKEVSGRYVAFLDSDDTWDPCFLIETLSFMSIKKCPLVYTSYYRFIEGKGQYISPFLVPDHVSYTDILRSNPISCLTALIDRSMFSNLHMDTTTKREDYTLWLNILKQGHIAYGLRKPLATYFMRETSFSRNKKLVIKEQWKVYRAVEKLSFPRSLYYFTNYLGLSLIKYSSYYLPTRRFHSDREKVSGSSY